jgi:hypothetical protein
MLDPRPILVASSLMECAMKRLLIAALLLWGAYSWWNGRAVHLGPGVVAARMPVQVAADGAAPFEFKGYRITPLARFDIEARVLSRETYRMGREADLSTTDFMLGWGRMSDESVLKDIEFSQSNRFGFWRVQQFPIPQREIETSAGNMHLIAANDAVERGIASVHRGGVVHMRGYLVRADASDGWHWQSSLSREDTGAGACELFFVEELTD